MSRVRFLGFLIVFASGLAFAAEPLPYGHKDFVPSDERPIYFRAGNGWYPGATPPLEWWEGTPVLRDSEERNRWNRDKMDKIKLWDFADEKAKNILWKAPVPGWSLSHPIVVGGRVFAVGEPDFVTCYDVRTGKQIWQRRIMPLLFDGFSEQEARAGQKVLDLARALFYVSSAWPYCGESPNSLFDYGVHSGPPEADADSRKFVADKREVAGKLVRMVLARRSDVEAFGDADLLEALDADLAVLRRIEAAADRDSLLPMLAKDKKRRSLNLVAACDRKLGVGMGGCWWGYVGTADSTLASDGKRIYGVFDQGQVFCCDLDGNLLWGRREKGAADNRGAFHRSPILYKDLLIVRDRHALGVKVKGKIVQNPEEVARNSKMVQALDKATGELRWQTPMGGSNYGVLRVMRLTAADGAEVDVLLGDVPVSEDRDLGQQIVRLSDGKLIGHFPYEDCGRGALMSIWEDIVTYGSTHDGGGGPSCGFRVRLANRDSATAERLYDLGRVFNNASFATVIDHYRIGGGKGKRGFSLYDVRDGKEVASVPESIGWYGGSVMAGKYLIAIAHPPGGHAHEALRFRDRDDRKAMARFLVVDLGNPREPKVVSNRNLVGYKDPPSDIIVKNYLSEFDPYDFAKCYAGAPSHFSLMGGPVPHGSRLFVQSTAYLYCIGNPESD